MFNVDLVHNFNTIVNPEDDVYILGDLMLGDLKNGLELVEMLNGKLHIVRGNHDTDVRWAAYKELPNVVECENAIYLKYNKQHFYLSHYPTITSNHDYDKPLSQRLVNLCGHSHVKNKWNDWPLGYIYHVEVDAHANFPVFLDDILTDLKNSPMVLGVRSERTGMCSPQS